MGRVPCPAPGPRPDWRIFNQMRLAGKGRPWTKACALKPAYTVLRLALSGAAEPAALRGGFCLADC